MWMCQKKDKERVRGPEIRWASWKRRRSSRGPSLLEVSVEVSKVQVKAQFFSYWLKSLYIGCTEMLGSPNAEHPDRAVRSSIDFDFNCGLQKQLVLC